MTYLDRWHCGAHILESSQCHLCEIWSYCFSVTCSDLDLLCQYNLLNRPENCLNVTNITASGVVLLVSMGSRWCSDIRHPLYVGFFSKDFFLKVYFLDKADDAIRFKTVVRRWIRWYNKWNCWRRYIAYSLIHWTNNRSLDRWNFVFWLPKLSWGSLIVRETADRENHDVLWVIWIRLYLWTDRT